MAKKAMPRFVGVDTDKLTTVPEMLRRDGSNLVALAESLQSSKMPHTDEFAPRIVHDAPRTPVLTVQYSPIGSVTDPRSVREPLLMLDMIQVDYKRPDAIPPVVASDPGVSLDNINAALIALGLLFHKKYHCVIDPLIGWYGIPKYAQMPKTTAFGGDAWFYVMEVRHSPRANTPRFQEARKDGYYKNCKSVTRNRAYPTALLDVIQAHTQTHEAEGNTASDASLSSIILCLRARGLWVAHQYYHRYKTPLQISYQSLMSAIETSTIDMLNINFDDLQEFVFPGGEFDKKSAD